MESCTEIRKDIDEVKRGRKVTSKADKKRITNSELTRLYGAFPNVDERLMEQNKPSDSELETEVTTPSSTRWCKEITPFKDAIKNRNIFLNGTDEKFLEDLKRIGD